MIRVLLMTLLLAAPAYAVTIEEPLPSPTQEQQAQRIIHQLKCVVCEGQALAESDAPLAIQMRAQIRHHVAQGKNEQEIIDYFVTRYGEAILLRPPLTAATLLLWLAPLMFVLVGAVVLWRMGRKERT